MECSTNKNNLEVDQPNKLNQKVNYSSNENDKITLVQPSKVVTRIIELKKLEFCTKSHVSLNCNIADEMYTYKVKVEELELERILSNLLNNSYEAIKNRGQISVDISFEDNECILEIHDTGKGIPENLLNQIGSIELSHDKEKGNGIALVSAKKMIEKWQGKLRVFSKLGRGTTVRINLPIIVT